MLLVSDYGVPQNRKRVIFVGTRNDGFEYPDALGTIITTEMAISDLATLENELGEIAMSYVSEPQNDYQKQLMRKRSNVVLNHVATKHSEKVISCYLSLMVEIIKISQRNYEKQRKFNVAWTRFASWKPAPTIDTGHRHHFTISIIVCQQ